MSTVQLSLFDLSDRDLLSVEAKLEHALECLDSVPNINRGGCGISALALYRWCLKNGVDVSDRPLVVLCDDEWDAIHCNDYLEGNDLDNAWFAHIAIEIDGQIYDSTGRDLLDYYTRCDYQLSEDELLYALNKVSGWNSTFKRQKQVPVIEFGLDVDLSDVDVDWR